jgi:hypothetical protein
MDWDYGPRVECVDPVVHDRGRGRDRTTYSGRHVERRGFKKYLVNRRDNFVGFLLLRIFEIPLSSWSAFGLFKSIL